MKSNAYWARRALQRENEAYLRGSALSAKLFREYEAAARDIRRHIGEFYAKYAGKHGLSYEQAARRLNRLEMQEWKGTLADYMQRIAREADPQAKARLTAQLDALSANSSISRLEALLGQIDLTLNDLYDRGVAEMKAEFGDAFTEGYYKKTYDLQSRAGWLSEATKLDAATVEKVLAYPWTGAMFSDRLWQNKQALLFHMRETLTQGLIQGKSEAAMSTELSARMGQSYKAAERVVRTETAHFHAEADKEAYRAAGVEEYEFMATLDSRTCETCGPLDGKHFKVADAQTGVNYPPIHPNCRCTTVEYDPDEALDWHNAGKPMPENMTWEEWRAQQEAMHTSDITIDERTLYSVTDEAVQAVPKPFFKGLSNKMNGRAQEYAKDVLRQVKGLPEGTEATLSFSLDGKAVKRAVGTPGDMRAPVQQMDRPYIALHNHASNDILSPEDIRMLIQDDKMRAVAAVGNKGAFFGCEKTFGYSRRDAEDVFNKLWRKYDLNDTKQRFSFMEELKREVERYGLQFHG